MIRDSVKEFVGLGPLPTFQTASPEKIREHQERLERIAAPISNDEANLLLSAFGDDDCFGLAWMLLHLIETAPTSSVTEVPPATANQWVKLIWDSAQRGNASKANQPKVTGPICD